MPKKYDWVFLYDKTFPSSNIFKAFCASNLVASIVTNNKTKCTVCNANSDGHNMENILLRCNGTGCNTINICPVRHKVNHCLKSNVYKFYKLNQHQLSLRQ